MTPPFWLGSPAALSQDLTIPWGAALREMRRVLRPDGRLIFIEHGRSTDPGVLRWQDRLTPLWRVISGGCHLNRPIDELLAQGGFQVTEMERGYGAGPRIGAYLHRGIARSVRTAAGTC